MKVIVSIQPRGSQPPGITTHWELSSMSEISALIKAIELPIIPLLKPHNCDEAFVIHILRIEIIAPLGLDVTIINLPNLISIPGEGQIDVDVQATKNLIEGYLSNPRAIILAILQTRDDIASQNIVRLACKHDPEGQRTVGILANALSKVAYMSQGTERKIVTPARSLSAISLKAGCFPLRDTSRPEGEHTSIPPVQPLDGIDSVFQEIWPHWKEKDHDRSRLEIEALSPFLQDLLVKHVDCELPKVWADIRDKLDEVEKQLLALGPKRGTVGEVRSSLADMSTHFYQLAQGSYDAKHQGNTMSFFSKEENRLRARVENANREFSYYMRDHGEKRKVFKDVRRNNARTMGCKQANSLEIMSWLADTYHQTRRMGGTTTQNFLSELFREQSCRWPAIAASHIQRVIKIVSTWIFKAVHDSVAEEELRPGLAIFCTRGFKELEKGALDELHKLVQDENNSMITYNCDYTDNLEKSWKEHNQEVLRDAIGDVVQNQLDFHRLPDLEATGRSEVLFNGLQERLRTGPLSDEPFKMLMALDSYYNVARKTFVDNVCRQVVERHLLSPLPTIFCPQAVAKMSDEELLQLGSESQRQRDRRFKLSDIAGGLRRGLEELQSFPVN
ncbi:hypothetical protein M426DRAFT_321838 [Hypoxylon sp. CI-4A]|nr:hypothetical protein M426DRAFT_321838 [Hypoxylon sp. CI-4A]